MNYILIQKESAVSKSPTVSIIINRRVAGTITLGYDKSRERATREANECGHDFPIVDAWSGQINAEVVSWGGVFATDPTRPEWGMITKSEHVSPDNGGLFRLTYASGDVLNFVHYSHSLKLVC